jgi:hypothetical protein
VRHEIGNRCTQIYNDTRWPGLILSKGHQGRLLKFASRETLNVYQPHLSKREGHEHLANEVGTVQPAGLLDIPHGVNSCKSDLGRLTVNNRESLAKKVGTESPPGLSVGPAVS